MNRRALNTILIILGVLGAILIIYFSSGNENKYSWNENYQGNSDQPYGTLFIKKLLEESQTGKMQVRDKKSLRSFLEKDEFKTATNYVFIGASMYLSKDDQEALLTFIDNGNNAFIASNVVPDFIGDLYDSECGYLVTDESESMLTANMNFYHESLKDKYGYKFTFRVRDQDVNYSWSFFNESLFCDSTKLLTPLGYQDPEHVNFVKIPYGKGNLYLHCSPIVFTNYFMLQKQKMDYASAVFSHMQNKNTIWEEFAKLPSFGGENDQLNSPLYYIMQQPSLKYAWWLIIASTVLYVLFAAKRTQRVIPVLEAKTNTSLEFVKMIAALHLENQDHMDMARKKMKYFYYFVRSRYGIHGHPFTPEMIEKLAEKSKVPHGDVNAVFKFYKLIEEGSNGAIDEIRLSNFYHVVESFYKKCK